MSEWGDEAATYESAIDEQTQQKRSWALAGACEGGKARVVVLQTGIASRQEKAEMRWDCVQDQCVTVTLLSVLHTIVAAITAAIKIKWRTRCKSRMRRW